MAAAHRLQRPTGQDPRMMTQGACNAGPCIVNGTISKAQAYLSCMDGGRCALEARPLVHHMCYVTAGTARLASRPLKRPRATGLLALQAHQGYTGALRGLVPIYATRFVHIGDFSPIPGCTVNPTDIARGWYARCKCAMQRVRRMLLNLLPGLPWHRQGFGGLIGLESFL